MLFKLTFVDDMYIRPCIVDDSRNSLRISILQSWDNLKSPSLKSQVPLKYWFDVTRHEGWWLRFCKVKNEKIAKRTFFTHGY